MTGTATAETEMTISVSLMGSDTVEVTLNGKGTVADVIALAAEKLGVEINADRVGLVRNGEQVAADTTVEPGDTVAAAPQVRNGLTA
ncbi:hypothetical protein HY346_01205 [Candidatus Microgenomates bacterium]|nr:hypothetical protein [Candidatus Microgenomates bacterium]